MSMAGAGLLNNPYDDWKRYKIPFFTRILLIFLNGIERQELKIRVDSINRIRKIVRKEDVDKQRKTIGKRLGGHQLMPSGSLTLKPNLIPKSRLYIQYKYSKVGNQLIRTLEKRE